VKDDAQRVALAGAYGAHAVPELDPVDAARTAHGPVIDGKNHRVPLLERHDLGPRLHARPLLGDHEFATREVAPGLGQEDRQLQREMELAIEVLVQAVVIAGP
jgi:hypothetical protein